VKNAISLGGDADTMACIAGAIAQAYYKTMPADIVRQARRNLPEALLAVLNQFCERFDCPY